ncbi:MAG: Zn-ribbon domain-containing OB-fold protein [Myxococcota bacterium]|nr:Zn-ribbon domain-containing OB-fold protein [Myxococcota bacterium]
MDIARLWREQPSNLRLEGRWCEQCDVRLFPSPRYCPECGTGKLAAIQFSGRGSVLAYTTVYDAPKGFAGQVPYVAALIQLDDGPVLPALLTDVVPENVVIGLKVEMVTRRIRCDSSDGPIHYGYKFAPADLLHHL